MRTALISRQLPTSSFPGDAVFTSGHSDPPLAFTQLGSYGSTHGGSGLVRTQRRAQQVLRRAGIHGPTPARTQADPQTRTAASEDGQEIRFLVRSQQALAVAGASRGARPTLDDIDPSLIALAVAAVEAVPGLDTASVTIISPRRQGIDAFEEAVVKKIVRSPHLRDYAAGSRREALRLGDLLLQAEAHDLGVPIPRPRPKVTVDLDFTGLSDPQAFTAALSTMVGSMGRVDVVAGPESVVDGSHLSVRGPAQDAAMIVTRSIIGFGGGASAHLVQCRPGIA